MARIPVPKEHGAWALLYGPYIVLILALGEFGVKALLLLLAITALFLAHEPFSRLVRLAGAGESVEARKLYWIKWLGLYLAAAAVPAAYLVLRYRLWMLVPMGVAILLLLFAHIYLIAARTERTVFGEVIGVVGLTATIPIGGVVFQDQLTASALLLWTLNVLYFSSAIFYVKMRVSQYVASKQSEVGRRSWQSGLYHACLLLVVSLLSWLDVIPGWSVVAFISIVLRAFAAFIRKGDRLNLKRTGYLEVAHTVFFILTISIVWRFQPV